MFWFLVLLIPCFLTHVSTFQSCWWVKDLLWPSLAFLQYSPLIWKLLVILENVLEEAGNLLAFCGTCWWRSWTASATSVGSKHCIWLPVVRLILVRFSLQLKHQSCVGGHFTVGPLVHLIIYLKGQYCVSGHSRISQTCMNKSKQDDSWQVFDEEMIL